MDLWDLWLLFCWLLMDRFKQKLLMVLSPDTTDSISKVKKLQPTQLPASLPGQEASFIEPSLTEMLNWTILPKPSNDPSSKPWRKGSWQRIWLFVSTTPWTLNEKNTAPPSNLLKKSQNTSDKTFKNLKCDGKKFNYKNLYEKYQHIFF